MTHRRLAERHGCRRLGRGRAPDGQVPLAAGPVLDHGMPLVHHLHTHAQPAPGQQGGGLGGGAPTAQGYWL